MKKTGLTILFIVLAVAAFIYVTGPDVMGKNRLRWENQVMPGKLSAAHTKLESNCSSCHTAFKGADDAKCISCHATNTALLGRQPTAFHVNIRNCASCHVEHRGVNANMRVMNHEALAQIGAHLLVGKVTNSVESDNPLLPEGHPLVSSPVSKLDCAGCHSTKDKHFGLFGQNCASCHAATQWTIPAFQHPSVNSIECVQCHQAPPSHYMMHFEMIDKQVASAQGNGCCGGVLVTQCYKCHQTTSFNDIKGVGFYKHH